MLKSHPQSSDVKSPVVFSMCQIHIRRVEWQTNTHLPLGMAWFMAWGLAHWIQDQPQATETHGAREAAVRQELQDLEKAHRCDFCGDFLAKKKRDGPEMSWDGFLDFLDQTWWTNCPHPLCRLARGTISGLFTSKTWYMFCQSGARFGFWKSEELAFWKWNNRPHLPLYESCLQYSAPQHLWFPAKYVSCDVLVPLRLHLSK